MSNPVVISIDAMGGDHGIRSTLPAVKRLAVKCKNVRFILVGKEDKLRRAFKTLRMDHLSNVEIQHASEIVAMDELPSAALRTKKDSSMRVAINLVKEGRAQACVSAGNTGALMATSRFVLKMLPGIDRPAIISQIPALNPLTQEVCRVFMLDLGANVDCTAEHLYQFSIMGAELAKFSGVENPRVGLLNIGEEEIKGLDSIKEAAKRLQQEGVVNYIGFVEADQIYQHAADVVVCDGFVGNVALKASEGIMKVFIKILKREAKTFWLRPFAVFAYPFLRRLKKRFDVAQYNGASLVGLRGIVVKSHGGADDRAFEYAIIKAIHAVEENIPEAIRHRIEAIFGNEPCGD